MTQVLSIFVFPGWFLQLLAIAWGAALLSVPILVVVKAINSPDVATLMKICSRTFLKCSASFERQIEPAALSPRLQRFVTYGNVSVSYALATLLLLYFSLLVILTVYSNEQSLLLRSAAVSYAFLCAYMAGVLRTQGGRELARLRKSRDT